MYCPDSFSLKDKRNTVQGLLDQVKARYNLSAAEVDNQDHHRLAQVAFAAVSSDRSTLEQLMDRLINDISQNPTLQIRDVSRHIF